MIKAEIVAHSVNKQGDELISVLCTFPRIILAEVNTHRMLSKNTSSSRAIPFKKMLETIENNPFIPIAWQKNHSGMQGSEYFTHPHDIQACEQNWLVARDKAVQTASWLNEGDVTKQLCNRLLEPFMWTTMLITGSKEGWDNFFHLRCPSYQLGDHDYGNYAKSKNDWYKHNNHLEVGSISDLEFLKLNKGQAEIHMMVLAEAIWDAKNKSTPKLLNPGEWHIPFEDKIGRFSTLDVNGNTDMLELERNILHNKVFVSTAMGARTSYTIVGEEKEINPENLISLHDRLISQQPPHSSPMEHCARCQTEEERNSFVKGRLQFGTELDGGGYDVLIPNDSELGWCYNVKGFIPYRYLIDNKLTL